MPQSYNADRCLDVVAFSYTAVRCPAPLCAVCHLLTSASAATGTEPSENNAADKHDPTASTATAAGGSPRDAVSAPDPHAAAPSSKLVPATTAAVAVSAPQVAAAMAPMPDVGPMTDDQAPGQLSNAPSRFASAVITSGRYLQTGR